MTQFELFLEQKFIESCIKLYRFYRFKTHLSNCFYGASINFFLISIQNDKGHLSTSAGVGNPVNINVFCDKKCFLG